jgi:hypothetical protein
MTEVNKTKVYVRVGIALIFAIIFIVDPLDIWPMPEVEPCNEESTRATCTGQIIFFWQTP